MFPIELSFQSFSNKRLHLSHGRCWNANTFISLNFLNKHNIFWKLINIEINVHIMRITKKMTPFAIRGGYHTNGCLTRYSTLKWKKKFYCIHHIEKKPQFFVLTNIECKSIFKKYIHILTPTMFSPSTSLPIEIKVISLRMRMISACILTDIIWLVSRLGIFRKIWK